MRVRVPPERVSLALIGPEAPTVSSSKLPVSDGSITTPQSAALTASRLTPSAGKVWRWTVSPEAYFDAAAAKGLPSSLQSAGPKSICSPSSATA